MKRVAKISPAVFAIALGLQLITHPAEAKYKPFYKVAIKGKYKSMLKETTSRLNDLATNTRQGIMAERLDLCYTLDGSRAYDWGRATGQAYFTTSEGRPLRHADAMEESSPVLRQEAYNKVNEMGNDAVFPSYTKEITAIVHSTAKTLYSVMPQLLRDAWLAEESGLLYTNNGKDAYLSKSLVLRTGSEKELRISRPANSNDALFVDSTGTEHKYADAQQEMEKEKWKLRWIVLLQCERLVGKKEILSLFADDVKTLRRNRNQMASDKAAQSTPVETAKPEPKPEPKPTAEPVAPPAAPAPAAPPQDPTKISAAVEPWREMTQIQREAFLVERAELCYMPDASNCFDERGWLKNGAKFIGTDGKEHDFHVECRSSQPGKWERAASKSRQEGREKIVEALKEEVIALRLAAFVYHLKTLSPLKRQALLSKMLGIYFKKDGGYDAFNTEKRWIYRDAMFVNTEGEVNSFITVKEQGGQFEKPTAEWNRADSALLHGIDIVDGACKAFGDELSQMGVKTAQVILGLMPTEQRDAWLAEIAGLLWMPDGKSAYMSGLSSEATESGYITKYRGYLPDAQFVDTEGKTHRRKSDSKAWERHRVILHVCVEMVSMKPALSLVPQYISIAEAKKEILSLFPEQVKKLRENNKSHLPDN